MIKYSPNKIIKKLAPERQLKKLLKNNLDLKRTALSFVNEWDVLDKKDITRVALKTINGYKERIAKLQAEAGEKAAGVALAKEILSDPAQLIQRVQNEVIFQVKEEIKETYSGESYIWTPSDASEPSPEHQLNYGKTFLIGDGEMPGDRYGCRCGMDILVKESKLEL